MNNELVSIVMATYNGEKYLRQQLDSISQQTYQHIELIVVDDGSTDNTLSIVNEYVALDNRIHLFPAEQNLGIILNFERGLKLATGDFIALADQDDIFRANKIELLLQTLKDQPNCDLVISDLSLINEEGEQITLSMWDYAALKPEQGKPFHRLLYRNFATGCAMMIRRRLLELAMPFPKDCSVHDWWLALVAASSKAGGICLMDKPLIDYRQHTSNACGINEAQTVSADAIHARLIAPARGRTNFEKRIDLYKLDVVRLTGYLQSPIWSATEQQLIEDSINILKEYENDAHDALFKRVLKLPQRLAYARLCGGVSFCLAIILHTLAPYK